MGPRSSEVNQPRIYADNADMNQATVIGLILIGDPLASAA
jgi:hypothetical protein